ncbi:unnamed protein product [Urochloa decumbens]|uniref:Protein kinase domain-containing protein n=1 Tax=Urochloa decumbens TaxID=240449 RepID=A0ABC9GJX1_9POAL
MNAPCTSGFISIDCGLPGKTSYLDDNTKISYAPDAAFIDTGSNYNIANEYITPMLSRRYHNVRSFPDGARNCYVLGSIVPSSKYLLRATFKYGDYDGLGRPPIFDLHIGVNPWTTVNITDADTAVLVEAIVVVQVDFVQVCLINTGSGTPFISGLDLRPLKTTLYPQVNLMQGLVLLGRMNFGCPIILLPPRQTTKQGTRHHYKVHQKEVLIQIITSSEWRSISTTSRVNNVENDKFEAPSAVMQTAITPSNASRNIQFSWDPEPQPSDPSPGYIAIMYFSELDNLSSNQVRQFYISLNGKPWYSSAFRPEYLLSNAIFDNEPNRYYQYSITISATANSTLPPIINALEVFSVMNTTNVGTDAQDGSVSNNSVKPQNELRSNAYGHTSSLKIENRRFTYKELEMITSNFQRVIGQGGFGKVYDGFLEDGTQVAVKLRSHSSNQGDREFLAEYMSEGTLQEHIAGKNLTWRQRLRIAVESAQGLEYLHKGCNPVLIHRDVKATNILLNANMEAKIADFGLSKAFNNDNDTHISTNTLVGTPGYVDPEYQATMQPTTKSDVYSFGVVLLELITGKPVILRDPEPTSIIYWVRQRLAQGNIEGIVDPSMHGNHDVNGVWKAAEIALKCTAQTSVQRPTMTDVVAQLQECLELEEGHGDAIGGYYTGAPSEPYSGYNAYAADGQCTDASQTSTGFEVEHNFGRVTTMPTGPAAQ